MESVFVSYPQTETDPELAGIKQVIIFMVVDLPAPFGPRHPNILQPSVPRKFYLNDQLLPTLLYELNLSSKDKYFKFIFAT